MEWSTQAGRHALGTLSLQSGESLPGAELSWKTYGTLAPARDNVIVYPTSYSAHHTDLEQLIGPDGVLGPDAMVHRDSGHVRQRTVIESVQQRSLPLAGDDGRQCSRATAFSAGSFWRRPSRLRLRFLNGGAAGLSLGGSLSRTGRASDRRLRQRSHVGSQPGLPAVAHGDAGGGPGAYRRRSLLHDPDESPARLRPDLCGLGDEPGLVSRQPSPDEHRRRQSRRFPR